MVGARIFCLQCSVLRFQVKEYLDLTKTSSTDLETKVMELNEEITILQESKDHLQLEVETWNDKYCVLVLLSAVYVHMPK